MTVKRSRPDANTKKLGAALLEAGVIKEEELKSALAEQKRTGSKLGKVLIDLGFTSEMEIVHTVADTMGLESIEIQKTEIEAAAINAVPVKLAEKHLVLPINFANNRITVAMSDPLDLGAIRDIEFVTGKKVKPVVATLSEIRRAIQTYYYNVKPRMLGEILVEAGTIKPEQLEACLKKQKTSKKKLGGIITQMNFATEAEIARGLSSQLNMPYIDLTFVGIQNDVARLIDKDFALKYVLVPLRATNRMVEIAMANPMDIDAIREVKYMLNKEVEVVISTPTEIENAIRRNYAEITLDRSTGATQVDSFERLNELFADQEQTDSKLDIKTDRIDVYSEANKLLKDSESPPVIQLVNKIILNALKSRASDIHIEPHEHTFNIRLRVDGIMSSLTQLSKTYAPSVVSRIKVMAKLDISERRIPQDGGIKIKVEGKGVDLRISTLPTQYGEKVVIRILDPSSSSLSLVDIGLNDKDYQMVLEMIEKPQGLVLVTGPTGSGKSTTLYSSMNHLMTEISNVITIEDPVEYNLKGAIQVNINDKAGLTFASALRSVLRQDPDIIMVGEMRDPETAEVAIQASITGHLVISTLHTTTAVAAVTRLKGMGIKGHFIASSLNGIIAQRLVRKLCNTCKQTYTPSMEELILLGLKGESVGANARFCKPVGCDECGGRGFRGRTGIYEIIPVNQTIRKLIFEEAGENDISRAAFDAGMHSITEDGLRKTMEGITTIEEVMRVTSNISSREMVICKNCTLPLSSDYVFCPFCGHSLKHKCPKCLNPRNHDWKFCPFCNEVFKD
ncbi:ATPase, T2SS/T4P/T4SS family [Candidatus Magnetominusculus xianensis]|uniref:Type II secretion system protein GspE n=1 Tax=Candidatus Magnetominusculus xianensis TaxID=1748249 RepID=A0ABR5SEV4_9BACT|nr:ATPase, T2SS/T4P/T4SS family [Candidatus Magnetominusculus xianensis]KWT85076.1 type II secretion system protein GspE [Candidatus Magnetominusculus xianensis]MBF0402463.1 Flp pilus assembly complex ATPase component TadA [Nitrospirota bacterium]